MEGTASGTSSSNSTRCVDLTSDVQNKLTPPPPPLPTSVITSLIRVTVKLPEIHREISHPVPA
jgi:hypothetical protein